MSKARVPQEVIDEIVERVLPALVAVLQEELKKLSEILGINISSEAAKKFATYSAPMKLRMRYSEERLAQSFKKMGITKRIRKTADHFKADGITGANVYQLFWDFPSLLHYKPNTVIEKIELVAKLIADRDLKPPDDVPVADHVDVLRSIMCTNTTYGILFTKSDLEIHRIAYLCKIDPKITVSAAAKLTNKKRLKEIGCRVALMSHGMWGTNRALAQLAGIEKPIHLKTKKNQAKHSPRPNIVEKSIPSKCGLP